LGTPFKRGNRQLLLDKGGVEERDGGFYRIMKMKRNYNQILLGDSIKKWLDHHKLSDKMSEMRLKNELSAILGPLAKHASKSYMRKGVYHIKVDSAPMRHELSMGKEKLKNDLNTALGRKVISEILIY
jgi:hypothetical protein